jgi:hypothetical protein
VLYIKAVSRTLYPRITSYVLLLIRDSTFSLPRFIFCFFSCTSVHLVSFPSHLVMPPTFSLIHSPYLIIADIDGAFFGPTFPNLFFMTYEDVVPEPVTEQVCPVRLFCLSVFSVLIVSLILIQSLIVISIGLTLLLSHRTPRAVLSINSAKVDRLA